MLKLRTDYAKKLGLPGFSSHQFSASVEVELNNLNDVSSEVQRLYALLQQSVDEEIQKTGFVPSEAYGIESRTPAHTPAHHSNGGNGANGTDADAQWRCSGKQRALIEKIVRENGLNKHEVESLAQEMFGAGVKHLDKLAASGLIDELLERYGKRRAANGNGNGYRRSRSNGSGVPS